ncbi:TolC family protein [Hyphomonas sp.]|uniref:TolC family protein n=1 Tax=Hyphomonas sp. TaxID=87 RepID=UPI003565C5F3
MFNQLTRVLLLAATAGIASPTFSDAHAQSIGQLEAELARHPALDAMQYRSDADRERATAGHALPDPVVSLGLNNLPVFDPAFDRFLPTNKAVGVRQQFPAGALRDAQSMGATNRAVQTDAARDWQYAQLRAELRISLIERTRILEQRRLALARREKYAELTDVIQNEIDAGRPALFRLAQVDIERADIDRALAELGAESADIDARLVDLVGAVPDTAAPVPAVAEWTGEAGAFHAVRIAEASVGVADAGVDQAAAAYKPEWGVQLTYQQRENGRGGMASTFAGDDWVSGMVTFTVPIWAAQSQEPRLRAAKADRSAARALSMAAARRAASDYAGFLATRRAAAESLTVLKQKIHSLEDQRDALLTVYESGAGDYSPIIDGELAILLLQSQTAAEAARRDGATERLNALLVTS